MGGLGFWGAAWAKGGQGQGLCPKHARWLCWSCYPRLTWCAWGLTRLGGGTARAKGRYCIRPKLPPFRCGAGGRLVAMSGCAQLARAASYSAIASAAAPLNVVLQRTWPAVPAPCCSEMEQSREWLQHCAVAARRGCAPLPRAVARVNAGRAGYFSTLLSVGWGEQCCTGEVEQQRAAAAQRLSAGHLRALAGM